MLNIKQDTTRLYEEGQIFVELTKNRGLSITDCDRLGYWCDKAHLSHFMYALATVFSDEELKEIILTIYGMRSPKADLQKEDAVLDSLIDAHLKFIKLDRMYTDEVKEWCYNLHCLQNLIMSRIVCKEHPDLFKQPNK